MNNYCKILSDGTIMVNSRYILPKEDVLILFPDLEKYLNTKNFERGYRK